MLRHDGNIRVTIFNANLNNDLKRNNTLNSLSNRSESGIKIAERLGNYKSVMEMEDRFVRIVLKDV